LNQSNVFIKEKHSGNVLIEKKWFSLSHLEIVSNIVIKLNKVMRKICIRNLQIDFFIQ